MDILNNIKYYSIFCPKYDDILTDFDLLSQIRQEFFTTGKKQKNKITKTYLNKTYHYSYVLEQDKPMRWKRMISDRIIEKSRINDNFTYDILFWNENKNMSKIIYFDTKHNITKIEYFSNNKENHKIMLTLVNKNNKFVVSEYNKDTNNVISYEVFPLYINVKDYKVEAFENKYITFLCLTDKGMITYCTKEQIEQLNNMKKFMDDSVCDPKNNMEKCAKEDKNKKVYDEAVSIDTIEYNKEFNEISVNKMNYKNNEMTYDNNFTENTISQQCKPLYQKVIKTEGGEKFYYFGEMKAEKRDGRGTTVTEDGVTAYSGDYADDKKNGFGVFYYSSGTVCHVGNFKQDKKHKIGISFNKEHDKVIVRAFENGIPKEMISEFDDNGNLLYAGRIENGKKVGAAVNYKADENKIIVSQYKNGMPTGKGSIFDENGYLIYMGEVADSQSNGFGIKYNEDGTIKYRGNFLNNKYSGHGKLYMNNGYIIEGNFENGFANGIAQKYDSNAVKIYDGNFKDGVYCGEGILYFGDGHSLKGSFADGVAQGILSEFNEKGEKIYVGHFEKGKYEGKGCLYRDGYKIYEGNFKNGEYDGLGCLYKNNECVYQGEFKANKKFGFGTEYCSGNIQYIGYFKEGFYNGLGIFFRYGLPLYVGTFTYGKKNGRINELYKNRVVKECIYENDELNYMKEYGYPGKSLLYYGNMKDNKKNGMGCTFTEFAEKDKEGIFANDEIVNRMDVFFKELLPLPECTRLNDVGYDDFRYGPNFVVEKNVLNGVYSGILSDGKPQGKGTILYTDHRYTGSFKDGIPNGRGTIYKNDGSKIVGEFLIEATPASECVEFTKDKKYNFIRLS